MGTAEEETSKQGFLKTNSNLNGFPVDEIKAFAQTVPRVLYVNLSLNNITNVPREAFHVLLHVTKLDLSYNSLKEVPNEVSACKSLKVLILDNNKIEKLGEGLFSISSLVELNLGKNSITQLDGAWSQLTKLKSLVVSFNRLSDLPPDLGWLPLERLETEGNERLRIPKRILDGGISSFMSYLQVVCEQHRLVGRHLDKFVAPAWEQGDAAAHSSSGASQSTWVPPSPGTDLSLLVSKKLSIAASNGVMDLRQCCSAFSAAGRWRVGAVSDFEAATLEAQGVILHADDEDESHAAAAAEDEPAALLSAGLKNLPTVYVADIRQNGWTALPRDVLGLNGLVVLNASNNEISSVPHGVVPQKLGVLNLSFNRLRRLPDALGQAPALQQMYLAGNELEDLPLSFSKLPMVDLFLSENNFRKLPDAVLGMTQLAKLSIACCNLASVPDGIGQVSTLKFLDFSFNDLVSLPAALSRLSNLTALNISFNPLSGFPPVVCRLPSLLELNMDQAGKISEIPPEIGALLRLEGLQMEGHQLPEPLGTIYKNDPLLLVQIHNPDATALNLSNLGLSEIPIKQLLRIPALKSLNLSRNLIQQPPLELGQLTWLTELIIDENPLQYPFDRVVAGNGGRALVDFMNPNIVKLDLTNHGLESLPAEVKIHANKLQLLKLAHNDMSGLPQFFSTFTSLNTLVLDNNQLVEVPRVALELPRLSILMLSGNAIEKLPKNIGRYSHLQALVVQLNLISDIPESIAELTDLKALSVASNQLRALPESVSLCTSLRLLDVSFNQLTSLPSNIGKLDKLKTLKAAGNQLAALPSSITMLHSLQDLILDDNMPIWEAYMFRVNPTEMDRVLKARDAFSTAKLASKGAGEDYLPVVPLSASGLGPVAQLLRKLIQVSQDGGIRTSISTPPPDLNPETSFPPPIVEEPSKAESVALETPGMLTEEMSCAVFTSKPPPVVPAPQIKSISVAVLRDEEVADKVVQQVANLDDEVKANTPRDVLGRALTLNSRRGMGSRLGSRLGTPVNQVRPVYNSGVGISQNGLEGGLWGSVATIDAAPLSSADKPQPVARPLSNKQLRTAFLEPEVKPEEFAPPQDTNKYAATIPIQIAPPAAASAPAEPVPNPLATLAASAAAEKARLAALEVAAAESKTKRLKEEKEAMVVRLKQLEEDIRSLQPGEGRAAYLTKHLQTLEKDPLRPSDQCWDNLPIMNVPKVIAAISSPPPPPGVGPAGDLRRPQVMHRFKRVVEQSNIAMKLLGRVQGALGNQGPPKMPGGGPSPPTPGGTGPRNPGAMLMPGRMLITIPANMFSQMVRSPEAAQGNTGSYLQHEIQPAEASPVSQVGADAGGSAIPPTPPGSGGAFFSPPPGALDPAAPGQAAQNTTPSLRLMPRSPMMPPGMMPPGMMPPGMMPPGMMPPGMMPPGMMPPGMMPPGMMPPGMMPPGMMFPVMMPPGMMNMMMQMQGTQGMPQMMHMGMPRPPQPQ